MLNDVHICSCRNWLAPSDHCRQQWNAGWPVVLVLVCRRPADRYLQWSSLLRPLDLWSPVRCLVMLERLDCLSWATETISTHLGRLCIALSWTLYAAHSWFFWLHCCAWHKMRPIVTIVLCDLCVSAGHKNEPCKHDGADWDAVWDVSRGNHVLGMCLDIPTGKGTCRLAQTGLWSVFSSLFTWLTCLL